jgi:hypothetical protein
MAAEGKDVLMSRSMASNDLRGPQRRIARLLPFHVEAYLHVLLYRIMVPLNIVFGASIFVSFLVPGHGAALKAFTAVIWVLWSLQLFEVARGLALAWSRGMAYGNLNAEFAHLYRKRYRKNPAFWFAFPWIVLALWAAGFVIMMIWWHP